MDYRELFLFIFMRVPAALLFVTSCFAVRQFLLFTANLGLKAKQRQIVDQLATTYRELRKLSSHPEDDYTLLHGDEMSRGYLERLRPGLSKSQSLKIKAFAANIAKWRIDAITGPGHEHPHQLFGTMIREISQYCLETAALIGLSHPERRLLRAFLKARDKFHQTRHALRFSIAARQVKSKLVSRVRSRLQRAKRLKQKCQEKGFATWRLSHLLYELTD